MIGFPDGPNNYLYANNDPVNKVDKLGKEAYMIFRKFNDPKLKPFYKIIGHFYLAFDERGVDNDKWKSLVDELGGQQNPRREVNYNAETFSYHPWSVRVDNNNQTDFSFNFAGTLFTGASFVGYNDRTDMEAFVNAREGHKVYPDALEAQAFPLHTTEEQQFAIYEAAIKSRNINNLSAQSGDSGGYMLFVNNCGTWAKNIIQNQGIKLPAAATRYNFGGTAIGGISDYTPLPYVFTGASAIYSYGKEIFQFPLENGKPGFSVQVKDDEFMLGIGFRY